MHGPGLLSSGLYRRLRLARLHLASDLLRAAGSVAAAPLVGSSRVAGPYHRSGIAPCPEGSAAESTTPRAWTNRRDAAELRQTGPVIGAGSAPPGRSARVHAAGSSAAGPSAAAATRGRQRSDESAMVEP